MHIICDAETEVEAQTESESDSHSDSVAVGDGVGLGLGVCIRDRCDAVAKRGSLTQLTVFWARRDKNTQLLLAPGTRGSGYEYGVGGIFGVMGLSWQCGIKNPTVVFWPRVKQLSFVATRNYPTAAVPFCRHCN